MLNYIIPEFKKQNDLAESKRLHLDLMVKVVYQVMVMRSILITKMSIVVRPRRIDYWYQVLRDRKTGRHLSLSLNMTTSPTLSFSKFVIVTLM